ncbi:MAG TPA: SLATT domain-containing protein [Solirubrobacterales bacterium]|nr:SLATT domain-containing protein [Solirubrobacterales bacterium]
MQQEQTVFNDWKVRAGRALVGHYTSARKFEWWSRVLTLGSLSFSVAAAVLSAAILSAEIPGTGLRAWAVVAASGASVLGLLQAQFNLGARAAHHRAAGAGYSKIRRRLELLNDESSPLKTSDFPYIKQLWDEVSHSAPIVPHRAWKFARKEYSKDLEKGRSNTAG